MSEKDDKYMYEINKLEGERDSLRREVERLREQVKWQPIDTATGDNTIVLIYTPGGQAVALYDQRYNVWSSHGVVVHPTHWQPLPEAPK